MSDFNDLVKLAFEKIRCLESQNIKPKSFIISEKQWQYAASDDCLRNGNIIEAKEAGQMLVGLPVYFADVESLQIGV